MLIATTPILAFGQPWSHPDQPGLDLKVRRLPAWKHPSALISTLFKRKVMFHSPHSDAIPCQTKMVAWALLANPASFPPPTCLVASNMRMQVPEKILASNMSAHVHERFPTCNLAIKYACKCQSSLNMRWFSVLRPLIPRWKFRWPEKEIRKQIQPANKFRVRPFFAIPCDTTKNGRMAATAATLLYML